MQDILSNLEKINFYECNIVKFLDAEIEKQMKKEIN